jgi:Uma2 family endonuclease
MHKEEGMASEIHEGVSVKNFAELLDRLGNVPLERICMPPAPGTATEADVIAARESPERRLCELVDGVLVEKAVGSKESLLAGLILYFLWDYLKEHDLGQALGADGFVRLMPGLVRIPDGCFISWQRYAAIENPDAPIFAVAPDLAIEVLSKTNTPGEIRRKLRDYFLAGTQLAWVIDPRKQTAEVYTAPDQKRRIARTGSLDGGDLLPGFSLSLAQLFARANRRPPTKS